MKKKIDTIDGLNKIKEDIASLLDDKIKAVSFKETVDNLSNASIGNLSHILESISDRLLESTEGKKIIGKYINIIKENKDLHTVYNISRSILYPSQVSSSNIFLSETLSLCKDINKNNLNKGIKALSNIIKEAVIFLDMSKEDIIDILNEKKDIKESINYLIITEKKIANIHDYVNNFSKIEKYINESINSNNDENTYNQYKEDCMNSLKEIIESESIMENKVRFATMLEHLKNKAYSKDTFTEDLDKLSELKKTLGHNE